MHQIKIIHCLTKHTTAKMRITLFYFSATGNSLHLARKIAKELGANNLISMAQILKSGQTSFDSEVIGLIFPVYAWGAPRIVIDFLEKINIKNNAYIFSIATCVGIPGETNKMISRQLKEKQLSLSAGFIVRAPKASLAKKNLLDKIVIAMDLKRKKIDLGENRLREIVSIINQKKNHKIEKSSWTSNVFSRLFHKVGLNYFKLAALSFNVDKSCNGCGTCVKLCPRSNIKMISGSPIFSDNCEFCHACIQWCPKFAIKHPDFDEKLPQVKHQCIKVHELYVN